MVRRISRLREYSAKCRAESTQHGTALLLAALLVSVGVYDAISTNAFLAAGSTEANPLVAAVQEDWGSWWFIPKLLAHVALALMILWLPSRRMIRHARIGIAIYVVVIASNFHLADWQY